MELAIETRSGELHRDDADADPAEVEHLAEIGFDSLLLAPVDARSRNRGLVEAYANDRTFTDGDIAVARAVLEPMGALLPGLESGNDAG